MECISLCDIPCLCTLSASAIIEPSLHQLDFFLEMFLWRLVSVLFFLIKSYNKYFVKHASHTLAVDASSLHVASSLLAWCVILTDKWLPSTSTLCLLSLPTKKHKCAQSKAQMYPAPKNFLTIDGCFECYMSHFDAIVVEGRRRRRRRRRENEQFWLSIVSGLPL